jgi:AcrR family transcriptional regulator/DNA-binding MarR family transcriptional regulator
MALKYTTRTSSPLLRPGPNGLPRGQVSEIQRSRMLSAAVDAVEDVGYSRMTVAEVIGRARVSRKTFYDVFSDREDCFLAAFEQALDQGRLLTATAYATQDSWRESTRTALARLLAFMEDEPGVTRLCVVEALGAGDRVLERRRELFEELARVIDRGRLETGAASEPPPVTAEGIAGAVFAVIHTRVLDSSETSLMDLLGPLMSIIVLPFLGARTASDELARPAPQITRDPSRRAPRHGSDPLQGLKMRLTYRTVRVLMVIGDHPGASNRRIAEGSGISDQGQISKLLNRLARLELIHNVGDGQEKGAANSWHLTPRGVAVERATRPR